MKLTNISHGVSYESYPDREESVNFASHHAFGYRWYRIGGLDYLLRRTGHRSKGYRRGLKAAQQRKAAGR